MILGVLIAIIAGLMLGLYALPEKYTKGYEFENTWGMMFFINMFIIPILAGFLFVKGFDSIVVNIPSDILWKMVFASILWGVGAMMWGKAINHIGLSLGFSIFIGTVILVGSLLPFLVEGLPPTNVFSIILIGIIIVLIGVFFNGKAGILRQNEDKEIQSIGKHKNSSMIIGIIIAVAGGLLATGFSYANAFGRPYLHEACQQAGNPEWATAVMVMIVIYVSGGFFVIPYFIYQLSSKKLWGNFSSVHTSKNLIFTFIMALLNFAASGTFAFAAYTLGSSGNTVGYAIFNTSCVAVAIITGLLTGEWNKTSSKPKVFLYLGLTAMIIGVVVIAIGNGMQ
ncbi:rhamnose/proton symporter RhaT [Aquimarina sp. AD10]|uniref:L-rhamnose/proton symporter RhaT n=1 Tax=Aquimarina sp. AD10 TaxID=1714849 RepID=UPI000E528452|nr:L-rhamnose/proton symporter RhaT [Aquimarina sp. AD10]AXT63214.1 rhamnose/proton symporter RhaT [Aquimarina sp. AD10]RKN00775.1 rhamnose/proton symporter RhaT [Aquimarina sp. AD10]